ncbi:hypothetical protein UNDYM_4489 [Undibacterium sp. YM2]|uniref:immunity protein Imm33 domain-containing protein n=1 Tax=Undibacterium sp. YM2 TaxID=2058625 RepID=UPI001331D1BB|nr:hypothetical protein [Undibacterium sp. YM2]BBB68742.1 hypothetical protein UNDYM_4489 [Undibacterium sp. YM2]
MNKIYTSHCKEFEHPEFCLQFDPDIALATDAEFVARLLESMVSKGSCFQDGQSMQLGWSYLMLSTQQDGSLGFKEADFQTMPLVWNIGISNTLRHLRLHKDIVERVVPTEYLSIPSFRAECVVCNELKNANGLIMMVRQEEKKRDSGWFFGCYKEGHDHNNVDNLERISLYEAVVTHAPACLPYLGFPQGMTILLGEGRPIFFYEDKELTILEGSYLDIAI